MTLSTDDRDSEIRSVAYLLWEEAGRPDGQEQEFWFKAVAQVDAPVSTPREQTGKSKKIAPAPSGMEQTDDQDNLHNNVSTI